MESTTSRLERWSENAFGIDPRALVAFRLGVAACVLLDLAMRAVDMGAHYTDGGLVTRALVAEAVRPLAATSLHALSGGLAWQVVLFAVAAGAALLLGAGRWPRLMAAVSFVLLLSLHHRNPYVNDHGDRILLLLLLWGSLLPLGARWRDRGRTVSIVTAGFFLQIGLIYLLSVLYKTGAPWRGEMTAVYYALQLDAFATPLGQALARAPLPVLKVLTAATVALEALGPLLLLSPVRNALCRAVAGLSFIGLHLGLGLTLRLDLFVLICIVAWLPVLPAPVWNFVTGGIRRLGLGARPPQSWRSIPSTPTSVAAGVLLLLTLFVSAARLMPVPFFMAFGGWASRLSYVAEDVGVEHEWNMFSPLPATADRWYAMTGVTMSGELVDVYTHGPAVLDKPALASAYYGNQRWRKFLFEKYPYVPELESERGRLARLLWRRWHRAHPDRPLRSLRIEAFVERTPPPGESAIVESEVLAEVWRRSALDAVGSRVVSDE